MAESPAAAAPKVTAASEVTAPEVTRRSSRDLLEGDGYVAPEKKSVRELMAQKEVYAVKIERPKRGFRHAGRHAMIPQAA